MSSITSTSLDELVLPSILDVLEQDSVLNDKLHAICSLLHDKVEYFDWVGFYIADKNVENQLLLGPYVGEPTDHTVIPYGKGICGQVAVSKETFISQDVKAESNYISCSIHVQSEIVVPILKDGEFVAQIDIDSNTKNAITAEHKNLLEKICTLLAIHF